MTELIIAEEHSQLYDVWLERGYRNLSVCHEDFHCDMRGLLINRRLGQICLSIATFPIFIASAPAVISRTTAS